MIKETDVVCWQGKEFVVVQVHFRDGLLSLRGEIKLEIEAVVPEDEVEFVRHATAAKGAR